MMTNRLLTLALGPILLVQGRRVRRTAMKLPEAEGPREGVTGAGPRLRLLVAGDSAAAGVGAATQDDALLGHTVAGLAADFEVHWQLEARTGATTAHTIKRIRALSPARFDVLVTSLGVNDLTRRIPVDHWLNQQRQLMAVARTELGVSLCIIAGLPPMEGFPALPQPLRWYLGQEAMAFSRALNGVVAAEKHAHFVGLRFAMDPALMAEDGFHPGPVIYAGWGERAAALIRQHWPLSSPQDGSGPPGE